MGEEEEGEIWVFMSLASPWRAHCSSEGLSSCQEVLPVFHAKTVPPLAPSGLGEVMRPPITSPEHITIFYLCGFSLLCELSNSPQSILILRMPSVACWVSLIQISCQQFTLESYSFFLRKEGTDPEHSEASTSYSVTEASWPCQAATSPSSSYLHQYSNTMFSETHMVSE